MPSRKAPSKAPTVVAPPASAPAWLLPVCAVLAAFFIFSLSSAEGGDSDFWWHLKTGEYVVHNHRLPVPDPFAFTTASAGAAYPGEESTRYFNLTHEWLVQAVMYLVWRAGGFGAIVFFRALLVTAICGLAGWIAMRRTGSRWWGIAAAIASAAVMRDFAVDRPSLLSYLLVLVFVAILESRRAMWLLPVLAVVWANGHGGFFLGWVVCGAYCAEALLRKEPGARRLLIISAAVVLLSGVNPNGFGVIATLARYRQSYMQSLLYEWQPATFWGPSYGWNVLLYLSLPVIALEWRRVRPADWLLYAAFGVASATAVRNAPYFAFVAAIVIATYFQWKRPLAVSLQYAFAGLLAAGIAWGAARGGGFQLRSGEWRYPVAAVEFLRAHRIQAPLFNTYVLGGYLLWKDQKVFIDGRALSETVFKDHETILHSRAGGDERPTALARYGIGAIVTNSFEYASGTPYELVRAVAYPNMADWKLVYEDDQAMVFLRDVPPGIPVIGKERIADHMERECRTYVERVPDMPDCARRLGHLVKSTNPERARRAFALYFASGGKDEEARQAYRALGGQ